jgi:hypothetical protein
VHKRITSASKRVEFVSDMMSYIILRGHWCHIIVLNVHSPTYLLTYSVALVRKRTIPTERPPLVGEVSANFCG